MEHAPGDADGLVIPTTVPSSAWSAVVGLRAVAAESRDVGYRLASAPSGAGAADAAGRAADAGDGASGWRGEAAAGCARRRAELSTHLADLAAVAEQASDVIRGWIDAADVGIAAMRSARDQVEAVRAADAAALASGRPYTPERSEAARAAWSAWSRAKDAYWHDVDTAGARLSALRDGLPDRPRDAADHLYGFLGATVGATGQSLADLWGLTGEVLLDPGEWWDDVSSLPAQTWAGLRGAVHHPLDTTKQVTGLSYAERGDYGAFAGTLAAILLPSRRFGLLAPEDGARRFAARLADRDAPPPRLQTVDEMLEGVDLAAHEHHGYGHAVRRHVGAGGDYLADRLRNGTLEDDGTRTLPAPWSASTFPDLATANQVVTLALRSRADDVRRFAAGEPVDQPLVLTLAEPLGTVMRQTSSGFTTRPGRRVAVFLARAPDGAPYVATAYLTP